MKLPSKTIASFLILPLLLGAVPAYALREQQNLEASGSEELQERLTAGAEEIGVKEAQGIRDWVGAVLNPDSVLREYLTFEEGGNLARFRAEARPFGGIPRIDQGAFSRVRKIKNAVEARRETVLAGKATLGEITRLAALIVHYAVTGKVPATVFVPEITRELADQFFAQEILSSQRRAGAISPSRRAALTEEILPVIGKKFTGAPDKLSEEAFSRAFDLLETILLNEQANGRRIPLRANGKSAPERAAPVKSPTAGKRQLYVDRWLALSEQVFELLVQSAPLKEEQPVGPATFIRFKDNSTVPGRLEEPEARVNGKILVFDPGVGRLVEKPVPVITLNDLRRRMVAEGLGLDILPPGSNLPGKRQSLAPGQIMLILHAPSLQSPQTGVWIRHLNSAKRTIAAGKIYDAAPAAGIEEAPNELPKAPPRNYGREYADGVARVQAAARRLGVQTTLSPGALYTLALTADKEGKVRILPMDQPVREWVGQEHPEPETPRASDIHRTAATLQFLSGVGTDRVAVLVGSSFAAGRMFKVLREGTLPATLEVLRVPNEQAALLKSVPLWIQGEDKESPRWEPAKTKFSPSEAVNLGAIGYKAGVLLGAQLPGEDYHPHWERLAAQNIEWVKEQARRVQAETGGLGMGVIAGAMIYAAPPRDYIPGTAAFDRDTRDHPKDWEEVLRRLRQQGNPRTAAEIAVELEKEDPAEWAIGAQARIWLNSPLKQRFEADERFAEAHRDLTYRFAGEWNIPEITLVMAAGPHFAETRDQWSKRRGMAAEAIADLKQFGAAGKWILPTRGKPLEVHESELGVMQQQEVSVGATLGRSVLLPVLRDPRRAEAKAAAVDNLGKVDAVLDRHPTSVWATHGINPNQAGGLINAARGTVWLAEGVGIRSTGEREELLIARSALSSAQEAQRVRVVSQPTVSLDASMLFGASEQEIGFLPEEAPGAQAEVQRLVDERRGEFLVALDSLIAARRLADYLPEQHPFTVLLEEGRWELYQGIARALLRVPLAALRNRIVQLTQGSVRAVTIDGQEFVALDIAA